MAPRDGGKLTFSFDAEAAGGIGAGTLQRDQSVRFSDVRACEVWWCSMTSVLALCCASSLVPSVGRPEFICIVVHADQ